MVQHPFLSEPLFVRSLFLFFYFMALRNNVLVWDCVLFWCGAQQHNRNIKLRFDLHCMCGYHAYKKRPTDSNFSQLLCMVFWLIKLVNESFVRRIWHNTQKQQQKRIHSAILPISWKSKDEGGGGGWISLTKRTRN